VLDLTLHVGTVAALLALGVVARAVGGRWLYPPAVFALAWSFCIGSGLFLRFGALRFSSDALLVFALGGVLAVAAGIATTILLRRDVVGNVQDAAPAVATSVRVTIAFSGFVLLVLIPSFLGALRDATAMLGIDDLATGARTALSFNLDLVPRRFATAASLGTTVSYFAAAIYDGRPRDRVLLLLAIGAPLALIVPTFSRTPLVTLTVGVLGILAARRRVPWTAAGISFVVVLAGAIAMGSALGKGPDSTGTSGVAALVRNLGIYFVGGPLGFSEVMPVPGAVGEHGLGWRFISQPLQSLGFIARIPDNVLGEFRFELGNVYTMYFAYWLDFGWSGIILVALVTGSATAALYEGAIRGSLFCLAGLGIVYPSIINVATGDGLFATAMPWILLAALTVAFQVGGQLVRWVRPMLDQITISRVARAS
jgi:oligosaccharide repeat unit polymerase